MVHFSHQFHPAGHGTFFSGHVWDGQDPQRGRSFCWVYDCGSKRPSHLKDLVDTFWYANVDQTLDVLCVSHFDSDHVSGLELLLTKFRVRKLVLPYISIDSRIAMALDIPQEDSNSWRTAAFVLNPTSYLSERGLADRYDQVVLVSGGDGDEAPYDPDEHELSPKDGQDDLKLSPEGEASSTYFDGRRVSVIDHTRPWRIRDVYELVFYNGALDEDRAPKSGCTLSDVRKEVEAIVKVHDLCSDKIPSVGWRKKLSDCYDRHFGNKKKRNDTSLCVLGRPLIPGPFKECHLFDKYRGDNWVGIKKKRQKNAVLMTGDLGLNGCELQSISQHVGMRWREVTLMQIPHHGSEHSWEVGTASHCVHDFSVICAPQPTSGSKHPSPAVMRELSVRKTLIATYETGVFFDFHSEA